MITPRLTGTTRAELDAGIDWQIGAGVGLGHWIDAGLRSAGARERAEFSPSAQDHRGGKEGCVKSRTLRLAE